MIKKILPWRIRNFFELAHRSHILNKAMHKFVQNPEQCFNPSSSLLDDLFYGWGNEAWSAESEYLLACVKKSLTCPGPILECGSGLSTLLVGAIAQQRGTEHIVFEHVEQWSAKVQKQLDKYGLAQSRICHVPIKDYGDYSWYDVSAATLPSAFSLVVCDGPPSSTKGGRYGLLPIMKDKLSSDCIVLLDDAEREQEHDIVRQWQLELNLSKAVIGDSKPYFELNIQQND